MNSMPIPAFPSDKSLRSFGLTVGPVWLFIAVWPAIHRGQSLRVWAIVLAVLFVIPALISPKLLRYPHEIWMRAGHALGWVNSRILFTLLFFFVFTPVGIFRRAFGKKAPPSQNTKTFRHTDLHESDMLQQF